MENIHPIIEKIISDWRASSEHPRFTKTQAVVDKTTQGVPLAAKDKDVSNLADDPKTGRRRRETKWPSSLS
jgi:hypothetical protein